MKMLQHYISTNPNNHKSEVGVHQKILEGLGNFIHIKELNN